MYEQKIIENLREFSAKYQYEDQKLSETCFRAADAIEELQLKWISVNEKLPPAREKVLVAYKNGVTIAERNGYLVDPKTVKTYWRGVHGSKHQLTSVTHWMPLPEPPKEETDG